MRQIEAFRLMSKRSPNARPIQLIREINHRLPGMRIVKTLENVVSALESYIGRSLLAEANTKAKFERQSDPARDYLVSLIFKRRIAKPADLELLADLLPYEFRAIITLASRVRPRAGASPDTVDKLQEALARSAQEYLFTSHLLFIARLALAEPLREFIYQLRNRRHTKRLFGFSEEQIAEWDVTDRRELARKRQERLRARKKSTQFSVTRAHR